MNAILSGPQDLTHEALFGSLKTLQKQISDESIAAHYFPGMFWNILMVKWSVRTEVKNVRSFLNSSGCQPKDCPMDVCECFSTLKTGFGTLRDKCVRLKAKLEDVSWTYRNFIAPLLENTIYELDELTEDFAIASDSEIHQSISRIADLV